MKAVENPDLNTFRDKIDNFELNVTKTWKLNKGHEEVETTPLTIKYQCEKEKAEEYQKVVDVITKRLDPHLFKINAYIKDKEIEFKIHLAKANEILKKHGVKEEIVIAKQYLLDLTCTVDWDETDQFEYPDLGPSDIKNSEADAIAGEL